MHRLILGLALAGAMSAAPTMAAVIDFEGYGANSGFADGTEDGFDLTYTPGNGGFAATSPNCGPPCAMNGTITFASFNFGSFTIARTDSTLFSLNGFDAAQTFTTLNRPLAIRVTGQGAGGPFVQDFLSPAGAADVFQSFVLGAGFSALTSVTFAGIGDNPTNEFQLDNIVVNAAIPEPATWALMIGGFGMAGVAMRRRARTSVSFG